MSEGDYVVDVSTLRVSERVRELPGLYKVSFHTPRPKGLF